jgi:hypothetical protein
MKRSAILATVLAALGLAAALAAPASDGGGEEEGRVFSDRYDLSLAVPSGWHVSRARLVPRLIRPREIVSVGTFGMVPGGGGNCGREPAKAVGRMGPQDGLISIQEYGVTRRMRKRLGWTFPPLGKELSLGRMNRAWVGDARGVVTVTIPFSARGRAFDALVYFGSRPSAVERARVAAILASLRFGPIGPFSGDGDATA